MKLKALLISLCLTAFGITALAADKPVDVRDVMTATQFHATGLDKLSPQEMAAFNAWLASYAHAPASDAAAVAAPAVPAAPAAAVPVPVPVPTSAPAVSAPSPAPTAAPAAHTGNFGGEMLSAKERGEPDRIETRILGTFTGWSGKTVFKLENGQVWQQADSSTYDTRLQDPTVVIKRLGFGYLLTLTGHGATVFVRRIQ